MKKVTAKNIHDFISLKQRLGEDYEEYILLTEKLYDKILTRKPNNKEYGLLCDEYLKNKDRFIKASNYIEGDKNFFEFALMQTKILGGLYD